MAVKPEKQLVLNWLRDQFPNTFFQKSHLVKPLKLGILEDIFDVYERLDNPPLSKKKLREALNYYTASNAYLLCQKPEVPRLDLFGEANGIVTADQAQYAQQRYQERQTNRKLAETSAVSEAERLKG